MNKKFAIETRHSTFKQYKENYESDLKIYLDKHEDNTQLAFLKVDLLSHKAFLKYPEKSSGYLTNELDEGELNQIKINSQNLIISFIENKIVEENIILHKSNLEVKKKVTKLMLNGTELNLYDRYKILNKVLDFDKKVHPLNIGELEKYQLLGYILGIDNTNARKLMCGRYNAKPNDLTDYFNELGLNK